MIHYHGTPITPNKVLIALSGHHFFVSFWRPDNIALVSEIASTFALDNGAFSAYTKGVVVDWAEYSDFVSEWTRPNMNFHVVPDVIGGSWRENMKLIESWDAPRAAPVWHMSEPLEMARELSESFEVLCIGGSVPPYTVNSPEWWSRINALMGVVCVDGRPKCKLHGLRMLDVKLRSIPFYSADSTNLCRNLTKKGMSRTTAALCIAERVASEPAAQKWEFLTEDTSGGDLL